MWLNTLLSGICVATAAWIGISFANDTAPANDDVDMYVGETVTTDATLALADVPDFAELQPMPLRDMLAPRGSASEEEFAAKLHQRRLTDARRRNAIAAMQQPVSSAGRSYSANKTTQTRRDRQKARRLQSQQSQRKYDRRQKTIFERTRHYSDNRYAYEISNSDGRRSSRVSSNRSRNMRVPIANRRRR